MITIALLKIVVLYERLVTKKDRGFRRLYAIKFFIKSMKYSELAYLFVGEEVYFKFLGTR